jgi:hypothetical protein
MAITFFEFNGNNLSNSTYTGGGPTVNDVVVVGTPTASLINFGLTYQKQTFTFTLNGNFNLAGYDGTQNTFGQLLNTGSFSSSTVTGATLYQGSSLLEQDTYGAGFNVVSWTKIFGLAASAPTVSLMNQLFHEPFVANSSTGTNTGDNVYGYLGSVTYYENHTQGKYSDCVIGGTGGINTVILPNAAKAYTINQSSGIWDQNTQKSDLSGFNINLTTSPSVALVQTSNVQRLQFTDTNVALDNGPTQTAGSVYMLYQATFNRTPDAAGLGYWINAVDKGANIITNVAASFVTSPEFVAKYGSNPSNASYVDNLYQNVLHRAGESGGVAYWNQQLNTGAATKAFVLEQFATLAEGAALVAPAIAHGIQYQQWVG